MSSAPTSGLKVLLFAVAVGCSKTDAPATPSADLQPATSPPAAGEASPAPAQAPRVEPWCETPLHELVGLAGRAKPMLRDRIATTPLVTVAKVTLSEPDCSSVGSGHMAFESVERSRSRVDDAHASFPLTGSFPPKAAYYLVGARPREPAPLDLTKVCLGKLERVDADALWVLPIADDAARDTWLERLANGTCGRPPNRADVFADAAPHAGVRQAPGPPKQADETARPKHRTSVDELPNGNKAAAGKLETRYRAGPTKIKFDRRATTPDSMKVVYPMRSLLRSRFDDCHEKVMGGMLGSSSEDRSGKMELQIEASGDGGSKAKILNDQVGDDRLAKCVLKSVTGLRIAKDGEALSYSARLEIEFTTNSFEQRACPNCGK